MPAYRVYSLDAGGHVSAPPTVIECTDDAEATAKAKSLAFGPRRVEIWQGSRQVAVLPAPDSPRPTLAQ
jgi:hypothetical protein